MIGLKGFIRNNAVAYDKRDNARTYLVTNESDNIIGYFSFVFSVVDVHLGVSKALMLLWNCTRSTIS